jgi:hypothetical protein
VFKKTFLLLVAAVAMLGAVLALPANAEPVAGSASARVSPIASDAVSPQVRVCDGGDLCFWVDYNYQGARGRVEGNNPRWADFPQPACTRHRNWSNCASSVWNNGDRCDVELWSQPNYVDQFRVLRRGDSWADLRDVMFNDAIDSNRWVNCRN